MEDIKGKEDIVVLVNTFYDRVKRDDLIGPIFNTIIGDDWSRHLPIMYSFWNTVLFGAADYKGQAIAPHINIDRKIPLEQHHFDRWITYWRDTVDQLYAGPNAELIKGKAYTMLQLIKYKVEAARTGKSLL
jgi:hemoglobin